MRGGGCRLSIANLFMFCIRRTTFESQTSLMGGIPSAAEMKMRGSMQE